MAATFSSRKGRGPYRTRLTGQLAVSSSKRNPFEISRLRPRARLSIQVFSAICKQVGNRPMASGAYPWGKSTNAASRCRRNWRKRGRCRCRRRICFGERGDPRGAAAVEGPSRSLSAIRLRNCASWCRKGSTAGRDDLHRWMKSRPRHGDACDLTTRHEFSAYRSERTC